MKADAKTEEAVLASLEQFKQAYAKRDIASLLALVAPDPDVVVIGTGADEKRVGLAEIKAQAERDWSQSASASFELGWYSISAAGSVAWVAADLTGNIKIGEQEIHLPLRMTGVLEQRGEQWLWVQQHLSMPTPDQGEGESWAVS